MYLPFGSASRPRFGSFVLAWLVVGAALTSALVPGRTFAAATITVGPDNDGTNPRRPPQTTIFVKGGGSTVTLAEIKAAPQVGNLLVDQGSGVWLLRANLLIDRGVTLNLTRAAGVSELRLRSEPSTSGPISQPCGSEPKPACDYSSFVYLRTDDGTINIAGNSVSERVRIISWDGDGPDEEYANGRSYILAKYDAALNVKFAELAYLGSGDGESYGVSWRDINSSAAPNTLRTRVTGDVLDSVFHHNYYGVYTYQASNMTFRRNQFANNVKYGFDPHDFTHHVIVEDNQAFGNGDHGFIISRGCNNFVFRRNTSYNNVNADDPTKLAHGFMLDSGSPNSADPQAASFDNLLENNEAYGNEGYGLRILGSTNNTIRGNNFHGNRDGITVEQGSTGNQLLNNTVTANHNNGIFVRGTANNTTVAGNTVTGNAAVGIYIKSNANVVANNTVTNTTAGDGIMVLPETTTAAAIDDLTPPNEVSSAATRNPEQVGTVITAAALNGNAFNNNVSTNNAGNGFELKNVAGTRLEANTAASNGLHGIYLTDGSVDNVLIRNVLHSNAGQGIRVNRADSLRNKLTENSVYGNALGGIAITSGANNSIKAPVLLVMHGPTVTGTAPAGTVVEIFTDAGGTQGRYFEGRTTALPNGTFTFVKSGNFRGSTINLTGTDVTGNSSGFGVGSIIVATERLYLPLLTR